MDFYLYVSPPSKTGSYHYSAIMSLRFTCRGFPPLCCWQSNHCLFLREVNISYLHTGVCQRCDSCGRGGTWPLLNVSFFDIPIIELLQSVIHLLSPKWVPCEDRCMSTFFLKYKKNCFSQIEFNAWIYSVSLVHSAMKYNKGKCIYNSITVWGTIKHLLYILLLARAQSTNTSTFFPYKPVKHCSVKQVALLPNAHDWLS